MYWVDLYKLIGLLVFAYIVGTVTGVYLSTVSVLGAVVWLIGAVVVGVGGIKLAGKDYKKK